jgi:hypothetical protein
MFTSALLFKKFTNGGSKNISYEEGVLNGNIEKE